MMLPLPPMSPASVTVPPPLPPADNVLATVRLFEITNAPLPFWSSSGSNPTNVNAFPAIVCTVLVAFVRITCLVNNPSRSLTAVYPTLVEPPNTSTTFECPSAGVCPVIQLLPALKLLLLSRHV